jgi:hypothetical protein
VRRSTKIVVALLALLIITCAAIAIYVYILTNKDDRLSFKADDPTSHTDFMDQYVRAREENEEWIRDPRDVASRYACGGECESTNFAITLPTSDRAVVIIEDHSVEDDSISATKQRIDLVRRGDVWEIEWAGWKQQCRRDDWTAIFQGRFGWHTQLCP